mmetsp:Transcript_7000/g.21504  ORF Transcript_7000/g.21504 Transcript_7000/m.21504 type:complete len:116 (-) Transcript_7000:801-1148(-)
MQREGGGGGIGMSHFDDTPPATRLRAWVPEPSGEAADEIMGAAANFSAAERAASSAAAMAAAGTLGAAVPAPGDRGSLGIGDETLSSAPPAMPPEDNGFATCVGMASASLPSMSR